MSQLTAIYILVWLGAAAATLAGFVFVVVPVSDTIAAVVERCG